MKIRELVASVYIVKEEKVLLLFHKKLQKWLPPGGHLDPNELPHLAAIREAKEETGLVIKLIGDDPLSIQQPNACTIPRPHLMLLEELPGHQHIDHVYLAEVTGGTLSENTAESAGLRWFTLEEVMGLEDVFEETETVVSHFLAKVPV